jgi:hypothetical protein
MRVIAIDGNPCPTSQRLDNRSVNEQQAPADPPPAGVRAADFPMYATGFVLVFVVGFAVVAAVLLSRKRKT